MSRSSSSCKCLGSTMQHRSGSVWSYDAKPTCLCGQNAVFRIARTPKNKGKKFWGCPNFKGGSGELVGCNFFKWCIDEGNEGNGLNVEERTSSVRNEEVGVWSMEDSVLQTEETYGEKIRLGFIEKSLVKLDKWLKLLVGMIFVIFVLNVIVLAMLVKVG
ncbi:uncharacterized protein HKW66_Vig0069620 [Vigna angularis]|uniref:GRF-type domain-containing protein n=1 Tax=Phaseolus angularis TaxID=3914 RepID=A0A8T0KA33_PHAAN|nr:uncharacterized protein HKW66_Vig0069620 [Vigna angularis]